MVEVYKWSEHVVCMILLPGAWSTNNY